MVDRPDPAPEPEPEPSRPAGEVGAWLSTMHVVLRGEAEADVPCDGCTACCAASQFIHIGPDEHDALAHIPAALRFPAPGRPPGHVLLGYDEQGRCPMLGEHGCSVYDHRPRTCRTYDCRVFAATDVEPEHEQAGIARRARAWRFDHPTDTDVAVHDAARAAARWFRSHAADLPDGMRPVTPTELAVLAVAGHDLFVDAHADIDPGTVVDAMRARRQPH